MMMDSAREGRGGMGNEVSEGGEEGRGIRV